MIHTQSMNRHLDNTRLSSRNQIVIPAKIRRKLNLKAGDKLTWQVIKVGNEYHILAGKEPKSWAQYTLGLGKQTWKNVDIDEYIKNLREEWEK